MLYSISNDSPSVMSIDKVSAQAGETVTVTNLTSSALSWELNGVSQTDIAANGTATFTMPAGNVVVAERVETYSITCSQCNAWAHAEDVGAGYTVSDEITEAVEGSTVYVTSATGMTPDSNINVELTHLGTYIEGVIGGHALGIVESFTMPAHDAIIGYHYR